MRVHQAQFLCEAQDEDIKVSAVSQDFGERVSSFKGGTHWSSGNCNRIETEDSHFL